MLWIKQRSVYRYKNKARRIDKTPVANITYGCAARYELSLKRINKTRRQ